MKVRFFDREKDYGMVSEWWHRWKWKAIPQAMLSKTGLIVTRDGKNICAAWLYRTDSCLCMFEWWISNPDIRRQDREGAIEFLIAAMEDFAKHLGFEGAFMSIRNPSLIKKAEKCGYLVGDTGMYNLTKVF